MEVNDLDIILNALDDMNKRASETFSNIFKTIGEGIYTEKEVDLILQKLVEDKYVIQKFADTKDKEGNKIKSTLRLFHITYDGHIFLKQGGYKSFYKNESRKSRRLIISDYALIFGGIGASIVAIPYIYNGVIRFLHLFYCFCY